MASKSNRKSNREPERFNHLCQRCGAPAQVHARTREGVPRLLCSHCAEHLKPTLEIIAPPHPSETVLPSQQCPDCGYTLAQFQATHLLGCPTCYSAFESQIAEIVE